MWRTLALAIVACLLWPCAGSQAASEIVIAIRYLQAKGTSHSHLYLYREDGKLLRQLTKDNSGQDFDPLFAPDGETIVFSRDLGGGKTEFWSVAPLGGGLKQLPAPPEWYTSTKSSPFFTNYEPEEEAESTPADATRDADVDPPRTHRAPDGSFEIVVRRLPNDDDDSANSPGTGKHFLLRDLRSGKEVEMGKLPGFEGLWDPLHLKGDRDRVFLLEGNLRVVFFGLHLNSTDGDTTYALDLTGPRIVRLSPNWAAPIPLAGEPAFLTLTYNRYVPIPGSTKTANCSYVERWGSNLKKTRYAREGSAAICYGASMYRPGRTPRTVNIRRDGE